MDPTASETHMNGVLDRLEHILTAENDGIGAGADFDLRGSSIQKSRCLYELTRVSRSISPDQLSPAAARRLADMRKLLAVNEIRLRAHLDAAHAVTRLLKDAVQAAEADGTYSIDQFKQF